MSPESVKFGRLGAHFLIKLYKNYKILLYRPSADWGLIFHQNLNKNIKFSFIGLRPIWGLFFNEINSAQRYFMANQQSAKMLNFFTNKKF
jgi:hypothetical protein